MRRSPVGSRPGEVTRSPVNPPAPSDRPLIDRLEVRGPFTGISGHDRHVRSFVRALDALGVEVQLSSVPGWSPHRAPDLDPWFESLSEPIGATTVLHFCMPHQALVVPGKRNVNYTMFEADRIHPSWVAQALAHDLVVVPTESSREAWLTSGVPASRVAVCPLGVDPGYAQPAEPLPLIDGGGRPVRSYRTRVLNIGQVVARKNLDGLLRVWLSATRREDDAILVLKLDTGDETLSELPARLEAAGDVVGRPPEEAAPVLVLATILADAQMPALYACASHYLSMSLGEGWDMPMVEAAACGLELLAPRHSAYRAYLDDVCAHLIDATPELAAVTGLEASLFRGSRWWRPDEGQAAQILRAVVTGTAPQRLPPREYVLTTLTWSRAAGQLRRILSEPLWRQGPGPRSWPAACGAAATAIFRGIRSAPRTQGFRGAQGTRRRTR
jgi:glycosyltransferase involved in cell wall biosynthesis